jgi:hypothetical protein
MFYARYEWNEIVDTLWPGQSNIVHLWWARRSKPHITRRTSQNKFRTIDRCITIRARLARKSYHCYLCYKNMRVALILYRNIHQPGLWNIIVVNEGNWIQYDLGAIRDHYLTDHFLYRAAHNVIIDLCSKWPTATRFTHRLHVTKATALSGGGGVYAVQDLARQIGRYKNRRVVLR